MYPVKSYAATSAKEPLSYWTFERRDLRPRDVLIDLQYCGVCHSDIHQVRDEWGGAVYPMVPGHEMVGVVLEVGPDVKMYKKGDRVGVGCMVDSCSDCPSCASHNEQYCNHVVFSYNSPERDGSGRTQGGYSTKTVVDERFVLRMPEGLALDAAAPLLCAGITTYSPLKKWKVSEKTRVGVMGLGGLGHMGVKFAKAMGAHVTVLSQSEKKQEDAKRLGADVFFNTKNTSEFERYARSFDLILNTVSIDLDWNQYLNLLGQDGALVILGAPSKPVPVGAFSVISCARSLSGSLIGGIKETQEMLDFCARKKIVSDIEMISVQQINDAYERMIKGDVKYRFVIDLSSLKKM